jgi:hypothetical protein
MLNQDNPLNERLMSLAEVATLIGRCTGKKPSLSTIWRWCNKGVRGVRLTTYRVGNSHFVRHSDLLDFVASTGRQAAPQVTYVTINPQESPRLTRTSDRRRAEIAEARKHVDRVAGAPRRLDTQANNG